MDNKLVGDLVNPILFTPQFPLGVDNDLWNLSASQNDKNDSNSVTVSWMSLNIDSEPLVKST